MAVEATKLGFSGGLSTADWNFYRAIDECITAEFNNGRAKAKRIADLKRACERDPSDKNVDKLFAEINKPRLELGTKGDQ